MAHVVDNLAHDMHRICQGWNRFFTSLHALTGLLCAPGGKELFLQRCVRARGLPYEHLFSQ
eukprot:14196884-Alexandrium_andersonii.AAC.1